jgi:hypothetical protein
LCTKHDLYERRISPTPQIKEYGFEQRAKTQTAIVSVAASEEARM